MLLSVSYYTYLIFWLYVKYNVSNMYLRYMMLLSVVLEKGEKGEKGEKVQGRYKQAEKNKERIWPGLALKFCWMDKQNS